MNLKQYKEKYGHTLKGLEAKLGVDFRILSRYLKGSSLPSLTMAYKIFVKSGKKVKMESWLKGKDVKDGRFNR